jgi:hypothetical protein
VSGPPARSSTNPSAASHDSDFAPLAGPAARILGAVASGDLPAAEYYEHLAEVRSARDRVAAWGRWAEASISNVLTDQSLAI